MTTAKTNDPKRDGGATVGIPVHRTVGHAMRFARFAAIICTANILALAGIVLLGAPPSLAVWRIFGGVALIWSAAFVCWKA